MSNISIIRPGGKVSGHLSCERMKSERDVFHQTRYPLEEVTHSNPCRLIKNTDQPHRTSSIKNAYQTITTTNRKKPRDLVVAALRSMSDVQTMSEVDIKNIPTDEVGFPLIGVATEEHVASYRKNRKQIFATRCFLDKCVMAGSNKPISVNSISPHLKRKQDHQSSSKVKKNPKTLEFPAVTVGEMTSNSDVTEKYRQKSQRTRKNYQSKFKGPSSKSVWPQGQRNDNNYSRSRKQRSVPLLGRHSVILAASGKKPSTTRIFAKENDLLEKEMPSTPAKRPVYTRTASPKNDTKKSKTVDKYQDVSSHPPNDEELLPGFLRTQPTSHRGSIHLPNTEFAQFSVPFFLNRYFNPFFSSVLSGIIGWYTFLRFKRQRLQIN